MRRNPFSRILIPAAFTLILFLSIHALGTDHVHFGSKNNPLEGLTVTWRGKYSHGKIRWGYTTSYEQGESDKINGRREVWNGKYFLYDFTFPVLKPSETLHLSFRECTGDSDKKKHTGKWSENYTFKTSVSVDSDHFTFIAGGDSRGKFISMKNWQKAAAVLKHTNADFYLYTGDLILIGSVIQLWNKWYKKGKDFIARSLVYHSIGNHETYGDMSLSNYLKQFVLPENGDSTRRYYSFRFGNAVFITLDTEFNRDTDKGREKLARQTEWLEKEIKKYRGDGADNFKEWVIVTFHRPFFTIGSHMGEMTEFDGKKSAYDFVGKWWKDIFDKYGVDVIINGHTHLYMRSIPLLVAGNGKGGGDLTFDKDGIPGQPARKVPYGNQPGQGRLQMVVGGYGAPLKIKEKDLDFKDQWYVDNYASKFHYCLFTIKGKELTMVVKSIDNGSIIDQLTIKH